MEDVFQDIDCVYIIYTSIKSSEKFNCKKSVRSIKYQKNFKSKISKFLCSLLTILKITILKNYNKLNDYSRIDCHNDILYVT